MKTARRVAFVLGGLTLAAALLTWLLTIGGGAGALGFLLIGWLIVVPVLLLATLLAAAIASLLYLSNPAHRASTKLRLLWGWVIALAVESLIALLLFGSSPVTVPLLIIMILSFLPLPVMIVLFFRRTPREDRTRPRAGSAIAAGAVGLLVLIVCSMLLLNGGHSRSYHSLIDVAEDFETLAAEREADARVSLAVTCLEQPQNAEYLDRAERLLAGEPPVFAEQSLAQLREAIAANRALLETFDVSACEAEAEALRADIAARGGTIGGTPFESYDWMAVTWKTELMEAAGRDPNPPVQERLGGFQITAESVLEAAARRDEASARLRQATDRSNAATELWQQSRAIRALPLQPLIDDALASAERIAASADAQGSPEARRLIQLAETADGAGSGTVLDDLIAYAEAANAMLGR